VKEAWLQPTIEIIMKSFVCPYEGQKNSHLMYFKAAHINGDQGLNIKAEFLVDLIYVHVARS
jgi:hypothetical protein